jgi:hypothetical protein
VKRFLSAHARLVAGLPQGIERELLVLALYLLEAQDVGPAAVEPGQEHAHVIRVGVGDSQVELAVAVSWEYLCVEKLK